MFPDAFLTSGNSRSVGVSRPKCPAFLGCLPLSPPPETTTEKQNKKNVRSSRQDKKIDEKGVKTRKKNTDRHAMSKIVYMCAYLCVHAFAATSKAGKTFSRKSADLLGVETRENTFTWAGGHHLRQGREINKVFMIEKAEKNVSTASATLSEREIEFHNWD